MNCNAKLCPNSFSVNVSVLAFVFRRQISKNRQFQAKLSVFEICDEMQQLVQKHSQKNN